MGGVRVHKVVDCGRGSVIVRDLDGFVHERHTVINHVRVGGVR